MRPMTETILAVFGAFKAVAIMLFPNRSRVLSFFLAFFTNTINEISLAQIQFLDVLSKLVFYHGVKKDAGIKHGDCNAIAPDPLSPLPFDIVQLISAYVDPIGIGQTPSLLVVPWQHVWTSVPLLGHSPDHGDGPLRLGKECRAVTIDDGLLGNCGEVVQMSDFSAIWCVRDVVTIGVPNVDIPIEIYDRADERLVLIAVVPK